MKCKNCKFCSGTQCYGHGNYWATCKLLDLLNTQLKGKEKDVWLSVCDEENKCVILESIKKLKKYEKEYLIKNLNKIKEILK